MSNIFTNSLSSLLQTFIKGAEEEQGLVLVAIACGKYTPTQKWLSRRGSQTQ